MDVLGNESSDSRPRQGAWFCGEKVGPLYAEGLMTEVFNFSFGPGKRYLLLHRFYILFLPTNIPTGHVVNVL